MILEAIRKRYSCRAYLDKRVEEEKLAQIFEAARLAPSAKNMQDWRFVVVRNKEKKQQTADCTNHPEVFGKAAVMIAACSNTNYVMRCGQPAGAIDVAIALEHISLQAAELGLATCWIGSFEPEKVRKILEIPQDVTIIELMALGYPADKMKKPAREPLEKIVCYDKWQF
ncbi:MAG: nitroreductase family protein [Sedimentisphaerales bacterium]|nr:nitroreductase family protein [Sedimentisphaerales bacterium]